MAGPLICAGSLPLRFSPRALGVALPGPGGAPVRVLMAGEFGADARLGALMQYLRVVLVAAVASAVARLWLGPPGAVTPDMPWFPALRWQDFIVTLMIVGIGGVLGFR